MTDIAERSSRLSEQLTLVECWQKYPSPKQNGIGGLGTMIEIAVKLFREELSSDADDDSLLTQVVELLLIEDVELILTKDFELLNVNELI